MTSSELLKWDIHKLDRERMAQRRRMQVGSKICLQTICRTDVSIPLLQELLLCSREAHLSEDISS